MEAVDGFVHLEGGEDARIQLSVFHAFLAAAEAEEAVTGSGQDDDAGTGFTTDFVDAIADFVAHGRGEHVAVGRAV